MMYSSILIIISGKFKENCIGVATYMNNTKFESNLIKQNEALYLQNAINAYDTMNNIDYLFGPFSHDEINHYRKALNSEYVVNAFQQKLIFNLFFKYFGDTVSSYAINSDDYIKLIIVAKKMLISNGMVLLPYILSGKVEKLVARKTINKKELVKMESSANYPLVVDKYRNDKIIKEILSNTATIISSEFKIIDPDNPELDGRTIEVYPDIIIEEMLLYSLLV